MFRSILNFRTASIFALFAALIFAPQFAPQAAHHEEAEEKVTPPPGLIKFVGKNKLMTADGEFKRWKISKAEIDSANPEKSVIELEIDVSSIDTKIAKRDEHLLTPDFFDTAKYPTAKVKIYNAKPKADAKGEHPVYTCKMDFTIHGVKKTFDSEFILTSTNPITVQGKITFNRLDFKIGEPYKKLSPMSIEEEIPLKYKATLPASL